MSNARLFAGTVVAYAYNAVVSHLPSRTLRYAYLRLWLGRFGKGSGVSSAAGFSTGARFFWGPTA